MSSTPIAAAPAHILDLARRVLEIEADAVRALADRLGDLHDLDVLAGDLESRDLEPEDKPALAELIGRARDRQVEACLDLGAVVYEMKPGRLTDLIREALSDEA